MFKEFTPCNAWVRAEVKTVTESFRGNCVPRGERQVSLRAKQANEAFERMSIGGDFLLLLNKAVSGCGYVAVHVVIIY